MPQYDMLSWFLVFAMFVQFMALYTVFVKRLNDFGYAIVGFAVIDMFMYVIMYLIK